MGWQGYCAQPFFTLVCWQVNVLMSWWACKFVRWWICAFVGLCVFELMSWWACKFVSWWFFEFMSWWARKLMCWCIRDLLVFLRVYQASELIWPALRHKSVVFILCWHHKDNKLLSIRQTHFRRATAHNNYQDFPNKGLFPSVLARVQFLHSS